MITRRGTIIGVGATFLAAPAIVRACNIMPVHDRMVHFLESPGVSVEDWCWITIPLTNEGSGYEEPIVKITGNKLLSFTMRIGNETQELPRTQGYSSWCKSP